MKKQIIVVAGPTAAGKTKYAIEIAKDLKGEIISADSMQIYKYMNIGSAKPTPEEMAEVRHHLVDEIDPAESFSVAEYQILAKNYIRKLFDEDKIPIICGGTGLYINSLIYEMDFAAKPKQSGFREQLEREADLYGNEYVHNKLRLLDEEAACRIHPNNLKKMIRAIEVLETTGESIKEFENSFIKTTDYDFLLIGLTRKREELYGRIDLRVDQLIESGLLDEVKMLIKSGLTESNISMKGIGYKEIIDYLKGKYDLEEAIRVIKRNTRHYAKRQLTWLKRYQDIKWFNLSDFRDGQEALGEILEFIHSNINKTVQH